MAVVKVCMDSETYIKGLVAVVLGRQGLAPGELLAEVLSWTCTALRLEPEQVAAWVEEVAAEEVQEALSEQVELELEAETPLEPGDEEAPHTHTHTPGVSEPSHDATPSPDESDGRAKAKGKEGRERE